MFEDIKTLGTVSIVDKGWLAISTRNKWLKLSEDIGGLTLIATFVRTDSLKEIKEEPDDA